jgi:hypothetical protein
MTEGCTCGRPEKKLTCRCTCEKCGSKDLKWVAWGAYLDKDLVCQECDNVQDIWDC